jgi:hypothetical protein
MVPFDQTPLHHWSSPHETLLVKVKVKSEMAGLRSLAGFESPAAGDASQPHSTTSSRSWQQTVEPPDLLIDKTQAVLARDPFKERNT